MFCPSCGSQVPDGANNCPNCGASMNPGASAQNYGTGPINDGNQTFGTNQVNNQYQQPNQQAQPNNPNGERKSKLVAGLLGILLGSIGIHNFYLGNTSRGVIQIIVTICTCGFGALWGFIEGIMILTGSINTDADGKPLAD